MPTLEFKGKQHVYAHHLTVPYRPLIPDPDKSVGDASGADGNLIIHGDNLHALKALLPRYAGRVKCIYIDPPYNTGNESWVYNDNVNGPMMQEWLRQHSPVDGEDLEPTREVALHDVATAPVAARTAVRGRRDIRLDRRSRAAPPEDA